MEEHRDPRSAAHRRRARVPVLAREFRRRAAISDAEADRQAYVRAARVLVERDAGQRRREAVRRVASQGGNVAPHSMLHGIAGVVGEDGEVVRDTGDRCALIASHFAQKWRCGDSDRSDVVGAFLSPWEGVASAWSSERVSDAFAACRRPFQVDPMGIAAAAANIVAAAFPAATAHVVSTVASCTSEVRKLVIAAVPLGKRTSTPRLGQVRMLLPLGVLPTVVDMLVAADIHAACDSAGEPAGFLEGGIAGYGRSASHVAHFARQWIEKGPTSMS